MTVNPNKMALKPGRNLGEEITADIASVFMVVDPGSG